MYIFGHPLSRGNHRRSTLRIVVLITAILLFSIIPSSIGAVGAEEKGFPFRPGERLTFQARWGFITAGSATLEVLPMTVINGVKTHHFVMETETNPYVDAFYKIRERQDSFTDSNMKRSILYKKRSEGNHPRDVVVQFDVGKNEASYVNFGERMTPVKILPGTFDPLALFFILRLYDLKENMEIAIPITDGKKMILAKAKISKRQKLVIAGNEYDTYLVEPEMESLGSVFKERENARLAIWFTADDKKIPVKIISRVGIGIFVFELATAQY
ncbi:MAG: DUF3108 domain-containing protein [Deltaproteobacteria bacterium]|nr:DUF3108 domain-containing protein [Deltaproteobacteria bacterium]